MAVSNGTPFAIGKISASGDRAWDRMVRRRALNLLTCMEFGSRCKFHVFPMIRGRKLIHLKVSHGLLAVGAVGVRATHPLYVSSNT